MTTGVKIFFWFSIVYITVALLFWGQSLYKAKQENIAIQREILDHKFTDKQHPEYLKEVQDLDHQLQAKKAQYWGEGITFFGFILLSAIIVYVQVRREHRRNQFQKNVMMYVTHELKTPIASVKLALQTLSKRDLDVSKKNRVINLALDEVIRLNDHTNNILYLSKIESKNINVDNSNHRIREILDPIVTEYRNAQNTHEVIYQGEDFYVKGDEFLYRLIYSNLISNAIKYSPDADQVVIKSRKRGPKNEVQVIDFGPGIEETERQHIFDKFYRIENDNNSKTSGSGLGLYIVSKLSKMFDIDINYSYDKGASTFSLQTNKIE